MRGEITCWSVCQQPEKNLLLINLHGQNFGLMHTIDKYDAKELARILLEMSGGNDER